MLSLLMMTATCTKFSFDPFQITQSQSQTFLLCLGRKISNTTSLPRTIFVQVLACHLGGRSRIQQSWLLKEEGVVKLGEKIHKILTRQSFHEGVVGPRCCFLIMFHKKACSLFLMFIFRPDAGNLLATTTSKI